MLGRFELLVALRTQVRDRALLRRYLAVEATMEELAPRLGLDGERAAMTGLGAGYDAQLCSANPQRRGHVAAELLATEGAPADVVAAVVAARHAAVTELAPLAAALALAEAVVLMIYAELDDAEALDDLTGRAIAMKLARRDPRCVAAADRLTVSLEDAATAALDGMRRIRADLRL